MGRVRLTTAQALVRFLANQYVEHDRVEQRFFAGCFGNFGHGNVAGVGQALAYTVSTTGVCKRPPKPRPVPPREYCR